MPRYGHSKFGGTPKTQNFEKPITPPLGVLEPKNFGFPSFSLGGTSTPKMIKFGEIRVLIHFDLTCFSYLFSSCFLDGLQFSCLPTPPVTNHSPSRKKLPWRGSIPQPSSLQACMLPMHHKAPLGSEGRKLDFL